MSRRNMVLFCGAAGVGKEVAMSEKLYRVADRDALERLRASGARILHRSVGGVVLGDSRAREIDGVTPVDFRGLAVPDLVNECPEAVAAPEFPVRTPRRASIMDRFRLPSLASITRQPRHRRLCRTR